MLRYRPFTESVKEKMLIIFKTLINIFGKFFFEREISTELNL